MRVLYTNAINNFDIFSNMLSKYQIILKYIDINTYDINILSTLNNFIGFYTYDNTYIIVYVINKNGQLIVNKYESIFQYLEQYIYYKKLKILGLSPYYGQTLVVDFNNHFWKFINSNDFFKELMANNLWIKQYLTSIENNGIFLRLSKNKRQRTYWNPTWNGGLPMINKSKKGLLREITFFCHDIGHFLLPDLIYTGNDSNDSNDMTRKIYCLYRLLGEATTVVINEMYLVKAYENNNTIRKLDPEWTMDLPYLLFKEINENANIENILWASVYFFVKGDHSKFCELLDKSNGNHDIFEQFAKRYENVNKRGVEWTCDNYDNLVSNKKYYQNWWNYVKNYCTDIPNLNTVDNMREYLNKLSNRLGDNIDIVDEMYKLVLPSMISKLMHNNELESEYIRNHRAFKKWIIGNLLLFFKYDFFENVKNILDIILNNLTILDNNTKIIEDTIKLYHSALKIGLDLNKIDYDDYFTFSSVYPMIDNNILQENNDNRSLKQYLIDYKLID